MFTISQISLLCHEVADPWIEAESQLFILKEKIVHMTNNITRLSNRPACVCTMNGSKRRQIIIDPDTCKSEEDTAIEAPHPLELEACLISCPWTIHDCWKEFKFGFHGFKPTKDWTASEREKDRFKYYKRNVFRKKVSEMIKAGYTAEAACDKMYLDYGQS